MAEIKRFNLKHGTLTELESVLFFQTEIIPDDYMIYVFINKKIFIIDRYEVSEHGVDFIINPKEVKEKTRDGVSVGILKLLMSTKPMLKDYGFMPRKKIYLKQSTSIGEIRMELKRVDLCKEDEALFMSDGMQGD